MKNGVDVLMSECVDVLKTTTTLVFTSARKHFRNSALIASCALCLVSCSSNKNSTPSFGSIDTVAIAADTAMQLGIESSYEFHKAISVHENLVYDVVGYGGSASRGEFAIMKRGADNKPDTVAKEIREGIITDAFLEGKELKVVVQNPADSSQKKTFKYKAED